MPNNSQQPYQDPKTQHPIADLNLPFTDYITQCQKLILNTRIDLSDNNEKILTANSPFELKPTQSNGQGILLIHGLLDTPFIMRDIGDQLQAQGFLVRAILLPGHGTVPGDLLSVQYQDWLQAVRYGIASFDKNIKKIYLAGFSTGAALALYYALNQANIAGVILLSPAIKIRSAFDFSANWHRCISWKWEQAKWLHTTNEDDYAKYQSIPFNAAYQVYKLTQLIKKISLTSHAGCPLFFILSLADATVSAKAAIHYFQRYLQPKNRLLLYAKGKNHAQDPNTLVRSSIYPELNIQEFSHIALPIAPWNPHYGQQGDYPPTSLNEKNNLLRGTYNGLTKKIYDALYQYKLTRHKRIRLSFNPDFEFMLTEMKKFISSAS